MTMESLPTILFGAEGKKDLSDLEYLSIKEFDGKRVDVDNAYNVTNTIVETDIATRTAAVGKDMYLSKAFLTFNNTSTGTFTTIFKLYIKGAVVEEIAKNIAQTIEGEPITFENTAEKVTAGEIIKITATNSAAAAANGVFGTANLTLWQEATGASPAE